MNKPQPSAGHVPDLASGTHPAAPAKKRRDPRLDFFRGIGMFIIFIAHLPGAWATLWIPARFGFSDATEIFVFCSGMASAIAFGRIFEDIGWRMGAARILYRMWQVYWAHIGLFLAIAALLATADATGWFAIDYTARLNLQHFFANPAMNLPGLLTLTYVPNYFDILPMYIAILAMIPVVMGLRRIGGPGLAMAAVAATWFAANLHMLELPAEPWTDRPWFFNPFAWQLCFFTGFAFMRGWIAPPAVTKRAMIVAAVIVVATVPFAYFRILQAVPELNDMAAAIRPLTNKTHFGILRYVHFLALAYLAWIAAGEAGARLAGSGAWGAFVQVVQKVGQQSLAVFLTSLVVCQSIAIIRDHLGLTDTWLGQALSLATGFAILIATAYVVGWFKQAPWAKKHHKHAPRPRHAPYPRHSGAREPLGDAPAHAAPAAAE
ncbi:OpgC domain-containing protein [Breoghania sp.]|uniref:OpgC family protein n=1 Tax=Breoghania sp. TaxID=2065378 RepID=UPI002AA6A21B|nr:OpgC domain-containing protein [Breoghania sp.]